MRVPAFSFMLHLFAVMILLFDVLAALSTTVQTLQNNEQDATDRELRTQDSGAKEEVVDDEERMQFHEQPILEFHLSSWSTEPLKNHVELSHFPTTSAEPSQLYFDFLHQMTTVLTDTSKTTTATLMQKAKKDSSNVLELDPYHQVILYIVLTLRQKRAKDVIDEADWKFHTDGLIEHGFTRDEVELLLCTADHIFWISRRFGTARDNIQTILIKGTTSTTTDIPAFTEEKGFWPVILADTSPGGKPPPDPAPVQEGQTLHRAETSQSTRSHRANGVQPGQEGTTDDAARAFSGKQAATTEKDRSNTTVIPDGSGKTQENTGNPRIQVVQRVQETTEQASNHNEQTHGVTTKIPLNYAAAVTSAGSDHEPWLKNLTAAATRILKFRDDNDLRPMIHLEKEVLAAWKRGTLVLKVTPGSIRATHSEAMRASFLQSFEQNLQGRLIATIPPEFFKANHTAETTLLIELRKAFDQGHIKAEELARISSRIDYNLGTRRVAFFLPFKHADLKLIDPDRLAEDDPPTDETSTEKREKHALNYQIRVLIDDLTAFKVMQIIGTGTDCGIATIARQTLANSKAYDLNYFLMIFKSENCPPQLKNVIHISAGKSSIFIHHVMFHHAFHALLVMTSTIPARYVLTLGRK
ncbi:hypothetical protein Plhal304r1_c022g0077261 [Plasmopara halstedii]